VKCNDELIVFSDVTKNFYNVEVLHPVSFTLFRGESLAILGPNGAGKTTMMRILLGVLQPDRGSVRVFGLPITTSSFESKKKIGVVIEEQTFFLDMSAWDYLLFFGELYGLTNISERALTLLKYMELYESRFKKLKEFSTGMKKKLNIIQAVLHRPEILILDEPFSGLDPIGVSLALQLLKEMKISGSTLIISTHILSEIDDLVESVMVINEGAVKAVGIKKDLWDRFGGSYTLDLVLLEENERAIENISRLPEIISHMAVDKLHHTFSVPSEAASCTMVSKAILDNRLLVSHVAYTAPSVKKIYEKIMNLEGSLLSSQGGKSLEYQAILQK
jgi:ABC-type multidrug transport system ATPase subunit